MFRCAKCTNEWPDYRIHPACERVAICTMCWREEDREPPIPPRSQPTRVLDLYRAQDRAELLREIAAMRTLIQGRIETLTTQVRDLNAQLSKLHEQQRFLNNTEEYMDPTTEPPL